MEEEYNAWNEIFEKDKIYNCFYTQFPNEVISIPAIFEEAVGNTLYMKPIMYGKVGGSVPYCAKDVFELNFVPQKLSEKVKRRIDEEIL